MSVRLSRIPFAKDLLLQLANDLLAALPEASEGDLSSALVILPSSRECKRLGHLLLECSGQNTLLLPRILTPSQLISEISVGLGRSTGDLPDPRIRPIILAHYMKQLPWLQERPESAPGLAAEYVKFFDEVRLYGKTNLILNDSEMTEILALVDPAEAEIVAGDLARIKEVWQLFRQFIPEDETDEAVALAGILDGDYTLPLAPVALVQVAGFGRIDPTRQKLLESILEHGTEGVFYLPEVSSPLSQLFAATWDPAQSATGPMAGSNSISARFAFGDDGTEAEDSSSGKSLRERIANLGQGISLLHPQGSIERQICGDPENESRLVAHRIVKILKSPDWKKQRIAVVANDANLAHRISAQLRAAGVDSDSSHGDYLSALPAGLLVRFILRSALMDLRSEPLLEVLAHPYVSLQLGDESHGLWTLRLEKMFRRAGGAQSGLAGMHRQAEDRDAAAMRLFENNSSGMGMFVTAIADAFEPLLPFSDNKEHPWSDILSAVMKVWNVFAGDNPLEETKDKSDITAMARLFQVLQDQSDKLPPVTLAGFSSDLGRLLSAENIPPHRQGNLPVQILGMVEARLEYFDHLIISGLREGVFPAKPERPVLFHGRLRKKLNLPRWQDALARDAELFLRLLHNAPQVLLTWSREDGGKPCLASPFMLRLDLCLGQDTSVVLAASDIPLWRKQAIPLKELEAAQCSFASEPRIIHSYVESRPQTTLSWSGLRLWRDCPYCFHLQRGLALRQEEEVAQEFSRQENGSLIHAALHDFLVPNGAGWDALTKGNEQEATAVLEAAAEIHFGPGSREMPVRLLWLKSFRQLIPAIIKLELNRAKYWKPVLLEEPFQLSLADLSQWVIRQALKEKVTLNLPALPDYAQKIELKGIIDRADASRSEVHAYSVLDYKTGKTPTGTDVTELRDMQLQLYAIAMECGATATVPAGSEVKNGFFYSVTRKNVGPTRKKLELEIESGEGRAVMIQAGAEIIRLATEAGNPEAEFPLLPEEFAGESGSQLPCRYCEYRGICRLEERDLGPVTGNKIDAMVNRKKVV